MRRISIRILWVLAIAALLIPAGGCVALNKHRVSMTRHTSLGAELRDLKRALDAGAITEQEYRQLEATMRNQVSHSAISREDEDR